MPLGITDLRHLSEAEQGTAIAAWIEAEKQRPFDWRQAPLLRVEVHRRGEGSFQFSLGFHHAILDGWSLASMLSELFRRYLALLAHEPDTLAGPPASTYRNFVASERRALRSEESRRFWAEVVGDSPRTLPPGRRGEVPGEARDGGVQRVLASVPADVSALLQRVARQIGVPLKSVLLAAHLRALAYLSGESEVTTGLITNGRLEEDGGERVLGLFLNTMPFRFRLAGRSWSELVRLVFAAERAHLTHRRFPLAEIQRLAGGRPLIDTVFNFIHFHVYEGLSGLRGLEVVTREGFEEATFPFAAVFSLAQAGGPLQLRFDIRDDLVGAEDLARTRGVYERTLTALAADPEAPFEGAPLLSEEERRHLLAAGEAPAGTAPAAGVHDLLAARAAQHPDAVALAYGDERVTYGALDAGANRLAHHLRRLGVGPETLAGLCLRRSPALLTGLFGILRAGGAYVPLDPDYPAERLALLLAAAQVAVVVSEEAALPPGAPADARTVLLDRDRSAIDRESSAAPCGRTALESSAYVVFTSGSTGVPKGVVALHGGLAGFSQAVVDAVGLGPGHRMLQFASPSFDASALQIFPTLISGATLVLHPDPARLTGDEIRDLCRRQEVTVLDLPAALWRQWVDAMAAGDEPLPGSIAMYMTGGEKVPGEVLRRWSGLVAPTARFLSSYGPTEATVTTTFFASDGRSAAQLSPGATPLGAPLAGTRIRLLDACLEPVPAGVHGEILIGGAGLTRGYLHRPDLTAERFVPDPFCGRDAEAPGGRLYRTGDLARQQPDGGLEFLGRTDHQVKIRGFRVEPAEIEAALADLSGVREAVVLAREHTTGDRRLIAYLVTEAGIQLTPDGLREALAQRLPSFMVPSAFVLLEKMPLLPSGKVDRRSLPLPAAGGLPTGTAHVPPRDPVERIVAGIWEQVLGVERVGAFDDFFALGGHSLSATQVITRIRRRFDIELQLRHVFESPTVAGLVEAIRSDPARRVKAEAAAAEGADGAAEAPIPRRIDAGPAPLSFGQQRLWFLHRLDPANPTFNLPEGVRLTGPLDVRALQRALAELVRRHEPLRTVLREVDGEPFQEVTAPLVPPLPCLDLTGLPGPRAADESRRRSDEIAGLPFDLTRGPVLRAALVRLAARDHALLLVLHHIVADGWSMSILVRELTALYAAFADGRPSPLPELPIQYADFASWQRSRLRGEALESRLGFWREKLAGAPNTLRLPTDRPRPAIQSYRGASVPVLVDRETAAAFRAMAPRHGVSHFMALVAALGTLLQRATGEDDLLLGAPVAGRSRVEVEGLIGFFVNMLTLRLDLTGDPSFPQLLARVRETVLTAEALQDLPFELLVNALALPRDLSRTPLFQVVLAFQNLPSGSGEPLRELAVTGLGFATRAAQYDLHFLLNEGPPHLGGALHFHTDLFDGATATRLARHFVALLTETSRDPGRRLSEISFLSPAERHQLHGEWNDTAAALADGRLCLHRIIEGQVARTPAAPAAACDGAEISYAELNARANRLARHLRRLGCGCETRVGVAAERSLDLLVALLATLKAGAAYVPLDPDHPAERLAYMLTDSRPAVLLVQERLLASLPRWNGPTVCLEEAAGLLAAERPENLEDGFDGSRLAYVLYTSGSTGRPKGAMVHHRGIVNRLLWMQEAYRLTPGDTVLQKTPFSFDVSVWELFWPLLAGARLAFARPGEHRDPAALAGRIAAEGATVIHFVPSLLQVFLEEPEIGRCRTLRRVVASGEALTPELVRRFHERLPGVSLENLYGPTEASVDVTFQPCLPGDEAPTVPIGRPIANTCIHIMDRNARPLPIGMPGELWIGGVNVGRGYLGRPDLTAEMFVPDPFASPESGSRAYRTGDLARRRPDGAIEYLGRIDGQVKLRGVRIEPGEIENALLQHPEIREAAVVVREDRGVRRLVAYHVAAPATAAAGEDLRRFLRERLPEAMVPALFVRLDALPLSPNGKLDRKALPAPDPGAARGEVELIAPGSAAEVALARTWSEVLGAPQVGALDNFFTLGGDSILSLRVLARARDLGWSLSLQQIFQHQTVRELARAATRIDGTDSRASAAASLAPFSLLSGEDRALLPDGLEDAYPMARLQAGMLFHSELDPASAVYHDISSIHLQAPLDAALLRRAAGRVTALHPLLRTSFALTGYSEPLQLVHREPAVDFEVDDLTHLGPDDQERAVASWLEAEKTNPLDWRRAPLLRFRVLRRGEDTFQFCLSFHHAILDGWSLATLQADLIRIYLALVHRRETEETPPPRSFRSFVALERETLAAADSRAYWTRQMAGLEVTRLPRRRPAPGEEKGPGARLTVWPAELSARLMAVARPLGVPLKSALLAAHARVLSALAGQPDVVTGLVTNGRPEEEGSDRALGLFLNTLPIRLAFPGGSWNDLLDATFAAERDMLPHRLYPLAELVREAGGHPLFEPAFNFVHFHVHQSFSRHEEVRSLGGAFFDRTNFTFLANFNLDPQTSQLRLRLDYDPDAFPAAQIEAVVGFYERALEALAAEPAGRYDTAPLLSAAERDQVLRWRPDTSQPIALPPCIHQIFEAQADLTPEAPAVEMDGVVWSYRELEERANRLASLLRHRGVTVDDPVGICLDRSLALPVAVLAALKAGGAYLPLDPSYPLDRLTFMAQEAGLKVLLAGGSARGRLPDGWAPQGVPVVALDAQGEAGEPGRPERREAGATAASLGYVLYTSGSTGRPKGVAVAQGAAAAHLGLVMEQWGLAPGDRMLQFASPSFDAWLEQTVPALLGGATLVVRGTELWEPAGFLDRARALDLTAADLPAAFWQQWVRELAQTAEVPAGLRLRLLVVGGEAMPPEVARLWLRSPLAGVRLLNGYGPTEAVISATFHPVGSLPGEAASVPLGFPLRGRSAHVLDSAGGLVPAGVAGELCLGGAALARGYLRRPELTAERFVPDPFTTQAGGRLYRTGDLARRLADGRLDYLGRIDQQVKVRGFRIELGEIEAALERHPAVSAAVVLPRREPAGGDVLVAYAVVAGEAPGPAELAGFLRRRLPEFMLPAAWMFLPALPLTVNGKVDRKALAALRPAVAAEGLGGGPRTPTEELLAGIFAEVLGVERVGVAESFFALGGHSLLATRVASRVRSVLGIELPVRTLFEEPTVERLAGRLAAQSAESAADPVVRISRAVPPALSFAQQRLWFLDRLEPGGTAYNMAAALELSGRLDAAAFAAALGEVVRRHEALRTTFREVAGEPVQIIAEPFPFPLPRVDLCALPVGARAAEARRLSDAEARRPFDLGGAEGGSLLRAALLVLEAERHHLVLNLHHIVGDGWSMDVLVGEVGVLYGAYVAGRPSPLPELAIQPADWAAWQRRHLSEERLALELAWWRSTLAGMPQTLDLPADRARPAVRSGRGGLHEFFLDGAALAALSALSRREGTTLFMTLLAAFAAFLGRSTGADDFGVGTPVAGRTRAETEPLIGLFVNTLVVRSDLGGDPAFSDLLARVRAACLAAYSHQEVPFERLVEELVAERDLSRSPLVQVLFTLQNAPAGRLELPGLTLTPAEVTSGTAKLDLTVVLAETGQGLEGFLEYSRDLFDATTAARLAGHLVHLLAGAVTQAGGRLSELPLLSPAESQQVFVEWNDAVSAYPREASLPELFAAAAAAWPDAPALLVPGEAAGVWSYRRLDEASNRLARHLRSLGVGRGVPVGLSLERSAELIVGLLAILKTGGLYVPLDASYPDDRLAFMLADSGAGIVLVHAPTRERLAAAPVRRVAVDEAGWETAEGGPLAVRVPAESLAYVIYTSGSTGRPKGVAVPHRGVVRLVRETNYMRLAPGGRVGLVANISFDAATWEIWGALLHGAALVVIPRDVALVPAALASVLREERVTSLFLTTALFTQMAREEPDAFAGLHDLLFGGEAADPAAARAVLAGQPP
ncbi:MAG TPA: non-ribosomal peptide synthetase, partial [Acidobacteria bacterium]|nr:non-ribosomal peptide synthetase [Acidobacteriota bacterium]